MMHCTWNSLAISLPLFLCGCSAEPPVPNDTPPPRSSAANSSVSPATEAEPTKPASLNPVTSDAKLKTSVAESAVPAPAIDNEVRQPATVAQAADVLDLATFPVMPDAKDVGGRRVASLGYEVAGDLKTVFEFQRRHLLDRKWKELSEPQFYDQSASGQFGKDGYHISVSVYPRDKPGEVAVNLQNLSNLNLGKLPVPPGAKFQYAFPGVASFETTAGVEETAEAVKKLLLDQGWQVYGSAGDVVSFKRNAVQLDARVLAPPAQPGKTVIDYSAMQMSADLPAPSDAEHVQYADQLKQLNLHALGTPDEVAAWYQTALAPAGWKSTTEKPVKDGVQSFMIFRNPEKELINLDMWDLTTEKKVRVTLNHQSAAEVEELDRRAKVAIEEEKKKREAEKNKPKPKAAISLPSSASDVQISKQEIEFNIATGQAKAAVDAIAQPLIAAGWKADTSAAGEKAAGELSLEKDGHSVKILYVDPGFIPAQVTVSGWGVELEKAAK